MNYSDLNKVTRKFLIGEGTKPGVHSYIQALGETLSTVVLDGQKETLLMILRRSRHGSIDLSISGSQKKLIR